MDDSVPRTAITHLVDGQLGEERGRHGARARALAVARPAAAELRLRALRSRRRRHETEGQPENDEERPTRRRRGGGAEGFHRAGLTAVLGEARDFVGRYVLDL